MKLVRIREFASEELPKERYDLRLIRGRMSVQLVYYKRVLNHNFLKRLNDLVVIIIIG